MPKTKIAPKDIPAILAMYAESGPDDTARRYGISSGYARVLASEYGVKSPQARLREEAKQAKREVRRVAAAPAPAKRVVLVCPGCFWAKGVGRRSICPRLGCGKVRRREETA